MRYFCLLWLVFFQFASAQINDGLTTKVLDTLPLATVLQDLEDAHNVRFAYQPDQIANKSIALNTSQLSLAASIAAITDRFSIVFKKIDERYYTITTKTKKISICGYLKSQVDNTPIVGVNIINKRSLKGTTTNEKGYFVLEDNRVDDAIVLSFLGYKTLTQAAQTFTQKECMSIALIPANYELAEVVVQEYLGEGIVKLSDGAIRINPNSQDILSGLAEPDILQNIQLLPGIESPAETASGLHIRGGSPDQNLILWDGIKMYNSSHFFGMISAFNPYITQKVNVFRSGTDPKYGDRISGVIDISTQNKVPLKFAGQAGGNALHGDANLALPLSAKAGLYLSARRSFTDVFGSPTFNNFAQKVFQNTSIDADQNQTNVDFVEERGVFNFYDTNLKAVFNVSDKDKVTISGLHTANALDFVLRPADNSDSRDELLNITNFGANASWKRYWNQTVKSEVATYYSNYKFTYSGQNTILNQDIDTEKSNKIREFGLLSHLDWQLNDRWSLAGGYQYFVNRVSFNLAYNDFNTNDNTKGFVHSLYSKLQFAAKNRWDAGIGIRANYYGSLNAYFVEPRVYIERLLHKHLRLKASAELRNQAVSQIVEFVTQDFGLENQVWALANDADVPLLKSDQLSVGLLYAPENGWHLDIEGYYKNIDGFTTITRGFESDQEDLSEGNSLIRGVDVLLKKKFGKYATWLGYTYASARFRFYFLNNGHRFRANNDVRNSLTWSHFYQWKKLQFSLGFKFRNGIPFTQALGFADTQDGLTINYGTPNGKSLPNYHRLDFSVLYDFNLGKKESSLKAKLGLSLLNVYDRRNILNRTFSVFDEVDTNNNIVGQSIQQIDKYALGITPNLFFRVNF